MLTVHHPPPLPSLPSPWWHCTVSCCLTSGVLPAGRGTAATWKRNPSPPPQRLKQRTLTWVTNERTSGLVSVVNVLAEFTDGRRQFTWGCFFARRRRLCGHRHRTAAACRKCRRLHSRLLHEKMLPFVSADQNVKTAAPFSCHFFDSVVAVVVGNDGWVFSAASAGSPARWTTAWWMTQPLTGGQRSVSKRPINHRRIVFAQPRMYKCDFLPTPEHLFNKWVQRWRGSRGDRWASLWD